MSHNFKRPSNIDPQVRRDERKLLCMAMQLTDQKKLDKLLEGTSPPTRKAVVERLTPYLSFVPKAEPEYDPADWHKIEIHDEASAK